MSFDRMDTDGNGKISYREFAETLTNYIENFDKYKIELMQRPPMAPEFTVHAVLGPDTPSSVQVTTLASHLTNEIPANPLSTSNESLEQEDFPLTAKEIPFQNLEGDEEEEDEEEEEEEATDDLYDIDEATGQRVLNLSRVKLRSFKLMAIGTIIVVVFSDPMCDILSEFGERLNIDAFYISFVLAPLASNASEVIASYAFARKKTRSSIAVSFTQLEGAGIMNNTFCVAIFLILIYARGLAWEFTAETTSIVVIELLMMFMAFKKSFTIFDGIIILLFYPLSLALVIIMEQSFGIN
jgi:Ca2+/Na+ antiporter